ncbi:MAG: aminoacyl-tRNA hydrolase [Dethiobacter sp.]|jgi:PTH1 family peptidyl-tRNA hydrolase|nr:aminoacyl-tRNA hydrolase [Dethiobacter sp.]
MHLIVGLGNPGPRYEQSRHNLGYATIDFLAGLLHAQQPARKFGSLYADVRIDHEKLVLVQPLTYMNRSGLAVTEFLGYYSLLPEKLILIYDDLDLPPGCIRIRRGGGSAGHRGVQSVIDSLGTTDFIRLRIGIGKPPQEMDVADYVLAKVSGDEKVLLNQAVIRAAEAVQVVVRQGLDIAMNNFN